MLCGRRLLAAQVRGRPGQRRVVPLHRQRRARPERQQAHQQAAVVRPDFRKVEPGAQGLLPAWPARARRALAQGKHPVGCPRLPHALLTRYAVLQEKRSSYAPAEPVVRYDGIYRIEKCWRSLGTQKQLMCRYLFVRCDNEPAPWTSDGAVHVALLAQLALMRSGTQSTATCRGRCPRFPRSTPPRRYSSARAPSGGTTTRRRRAGAGPARRRPARRVSAMRRALLVSSSNHSRPLSLRRTAQEGAQAAERAAEAAQGVWLQALRKGAERAAEHAVRPHFLQRLPGVQV